MITGKNTLKLDSGVSSKLDSSIGEFEVLIRLSLVLLSIKGVFLSVKYSENYSHD